MVNDVINGKRFTNGELVAIPAPATAPGFSCPPLKLSPAVPITLMSRETRPQGRNKLIVRITLARRVRAFL